MYSLSLMLIVDVDECSAQTDSCQQDCINTLGSYSCACRTGYITVNTTKCIGEMNFEVVSEAPLCFLSL